MLKVESYLLRKPEPKDLEFFYVAKNNIDITNLLGGFNRGLSQKDLEQWLESHRLNQNDLLLTIADVDDNAVGQIGLYKIDHRIGMAEFAIMIGIKDLWGQGLGKKLTRRMMEYAFDSLNLQRVYLEVLENNHRAYQLYESLGFKLEGRLRRAQYKQGQYLDVILMGLLKEDYVGTRV
jgi:RimJ/RimL family protein N-acetyltransferase